MRSLAAAISPGYFGFIDWAFAAVAPSEIAVQVPIATRKNNLLIIVSLPFLPCDQLDNSQAIPLIRCRNVASVDVMAITKWSISESGVL
jgi:hypothetical protein